MSLQDTQMSSLFSSNTDDEFGELSSSKLYQYDSTASNEYVNQEPQQDDFLLFNTNNEDFTQMKEQDLFFENEFTTSEIHTPQYQNQEQQQQQDFQQQQQFCMPKIEVNQGVEQQQQNQYEEQQQQRPYFQLSQQYSYPPQQQQQQQQEFQLKQEGTQAQNFQEQLNYLRKYRQQKQEEEQQQKQSFQQLNQQQFQLFDLSFIQNYQNNNNNNQQQQLQNNQQREIVKQESQNTDAQLELLRMASKKVKKVKLNHKNQIASAETKNVPATIGNVLLNKLKEKLPDNLEIQKTQKVKNILDLKKLFSMSEEIQKLCVRFLQSGPMMSYIASSTRIKQKRLVVKYIDVIIQGCLDPTNFGCFKKYAN